MTDNNKNILILRNKLHKDALLIRTISILTIIYGIIFTSDNTFFGSNEFFEELVVKPFILICCLTMIIINKKNQEKLISFLSIIIAILMIFFYIGSSSLIGLMYLLLGIIYIKHAIDYLRYGNFRTEDVKKTKNSKFRYVALICIVTVFLPVAYNLKILFSLLGLISCIIGHIMKEKSLLLYICFVISILLVFTYLLLLTS